MNHYSEAAEEHHDALKKQRTQQSEAHKLLQQYEDLNRGNIQLKRIKCRYSNTSLICSA